MIDYLNPHHVYIDAQAAPDLGVEVKRSVNDMPKTIDNQCKPERFYESSVSYDTVPAADCPVCGGMYKGQSCEVCGYDGEAQPDKPGKDAIIRHCLRKLTPDGERMATNDR